MKQTIRFLLIPLALTLFIIGFIVGQRLVFGIMGVGLLIFDVLFYSTRKQRVRYWIQGYKINLIKNKNDVIDSINLIKKEFCNSKYASDDICSKNYKNIDSLIADIIKEEFNFRNLLNTNADSIIKVYEGMALYQGEIEKLARQIEIVKKEEGILDE